MSKLRDLLASRAPSGEASEAAGLQLLFVPPTRRLYAVRKCLRQTQARLRTTVAFTGDYPFAAVCRRVYAPTRVKDVIFHPIARYDTG